jgi:hypothetical protein
MQRFREFIMERAAFVNLSDTKGDESLGVLDRDEDATLIDQIKNVINKKSVNSLAEDILAKHGFPTIPELTSRFSEMMLSYLKGDIAAFRQKVLEDPVNLKLTTGKKMVSDITSQYSSWLPKPFFDTLFNWNPSVFGTTMGRGEFLLGLFTQLTRAQKGGDLAEGSKKIEVKGAGFRAMGQSHAAARRFSPQAVKDMQDVLNTIYGSPEAAMEHVPTTKLVYDQKRVGLMVLKVFFSAILANKKTVFKNKDTVKAIATAVSNYNNPLPPEAIASMIKAINTGSEQMFLNTAAALHLWNYISNEKFEYLLLFSPSYDSFFVLNTANLTFDKLLAMVGNTIKTVSYGWDTTRSSFSFAFAG